MTYRDATEAELMLEPDAALAAMAAGELGVSDATQELAKAVLDRRLLGETTGKTEA